MKKNQLIVISVLFIIAVIIAAIFFPSADTDDAAGTVGKVKKYRDSKTSQKDIVLRNEFLKDTAALGAAIQIFGRFEYYLSDFKSELTDWENSLVNLKIKNEKLGKQIFELKQLAQFMENNLQTVAETKTLLEKYYTKDTLDMTIDVENNLIHFQTFTDNLEEKSKVLDSLLVNLGDILEKDKINKIFKTKKEADALVAVREKMLAGIFIHAYMFGNEERLNSVLSSNVINSTLSGIYITNKLSGIVFADDKLRALNKEKLNIIFSKDMYNRYYNKENLEGIEIGAAVNAALDNKPLGIILNLPELGIIIYTNKYVFSKDKLGNVQGSTELLSGTSLNRLFNFSGGFNAIANKTLN